MDGGTDRARIVAAGVLPGAVTRLGEMRVGDVFLGITANIGREASDSKTIQLFDSAPQRVDTVARRFAFMVSPLR